MVACAIHQPNFAPWLGYFVKIAISDHFVFLDTVLFSKGSYINRVKVQGAGVEAGWLTVPVQKQGLSSTLIRDVKVSDAAEVAEALKRKLAAYYHGARFRDELMDLVSPALDGRHGDLSDLNIDLVRRVAEAGGLTAVLHRSSALEARDEDPSERLADLCRAVGADEYICGSGSAGYQDSRPFEEAGVRASRYRFREPPLSNGVDDLPGGLSVIERIAHAGLDGFRRDLQAAVNGATTEPA